MIAFLIALLISLGIISSEADYDNLTDEEQTHYQSTTINEDIHGI